MPTHVTENPLKEDIAEEKEDIERLEELVSAKTILGIAFIFLIALWFAVRGMLGKFLPGQSRQKSSDNDK